ncbi:MAG: hypothetical protein MZV70_53775 [Desulfobacterales bacterium]|nr:hypothetical protein [Desulfobacterales bacterium]
MQSHDTRWCPGRLGGHADGIENGETGNPTESGRRHRISAATEAGS